MLPFRAVFFLYFTALISSLNRLLEKTLIIKFNLRTNDQSDVFSRLYFDSISKSLSDQLNRHFVLFFNSYLGFIRCYSWKMFSSCISWGCQLGKAFNAKRSCELFEIFQKLLLRMYVFLRFPNELSTNQMTKTSQKEEIERTNSPNYFFLMANEICFVQWRGLGGT